MEQIVEFLVSNSPWILLAVGILKAIVMVTPSKTDDKILNFLLKVINILEGNFGKARNFDDVIPDKEVADEVRKIADSLGADELRKRLRPPGAS